VASEITRIAPLRAGLVTAVLYAIMMGLMSLFIVPFLFLVPVPEAQPGQPDPAAALAQMRWLILLYPVMGLFFGWLFGWGGALAYNLVSRFTGGFLVETEDRAR